MHLLHVLPLVVYYSTLIIGAHACYNKPCTIVLMRCSRAPSIFLREKSAVKNSMPFSVFDLTGILVLIPIHVRLAV